MSSIRIHGRPEVFSCNLTTSILNVLMQNTFPIETVCGGRAVCGRDLIRVRSGAEFLSPRRERETRRLAELAREGEPSGPGHAAGLPDIRQGGRRNRGNSPLPCHAGGLISPFAVLYLTRMWRSLARKVILFSIPVLLAACGDQSLFMSLKNDTSDLSINSISDGQIVTSGKSVPLLIAAENTGKSRDVEIEVTLSSAAGQSMWHNRASAAVNEQIPIALPPDLAVGMYKLDLVLYSSGEVAQKKSASFFVAGDGWKITGIKSFPPSSRQRQPSCSRPSCRRRPARMPTSAGPGRARSLPRAR